MKNIKETTRLQLTVELIEMTMSDGRTLYLASIPYIACGSGTTPVEAYRGLAHCLAFGDDDVNPQEAVGPWLKVINEALDRSHAPIDVVDEQMALPFLTTPQGEG